MVHIRMIPEISVVIATGSCFSLWTSFYFVLCILFPEQSSEWNCRVVTCCHALVSVSLCLYCGLYIGPWPFDALGDPSTTLQTLCIVVTLGYFLFDFIWCQVTGSEGPDMLLHHMTSICGLVASLILDSSGAELIATIFGSEISNPTLQFRWFLRETGMYETHIAKINDMIFIMLFVLIRICLGACLFVYTMLSTKTHYFIKLGGVALYTISFVWLILILKFAKKRFLKKSRN